MRSIRRSLLSAILTMAPLASMAQTGGVKASTHPTPAQMSPKMMVIGQEVLRDQWPGTLLLVNPPENRSMILPGQSISIAVTAIGDERDTFLMGSSFTFEIECDGKKLSYPGIHPSQVKRLKPEGGDFVMHVLDSVKLDPSQQKGMPKDLSMASLATFDVVWPAPAGGKDGIARISGTALLPTGGAFRFEETKLPVSSFETAVQKGAFKNDEEFNGWMMCYYKQPNPARILPALRLESDDKMAFSHSLRTFFVEVLKSSPECARDLQARLPKETPPVRGYAIHLLQQAGYDITSLLQQLPDIEKEFQKRVPPLPDPYDLHIVLEQFDTPQRMDALWSCFLATGKARPVRAIADLLLWRDDYQAIKEAQKTPQVSKSLTPEFARGVSYMAAGWSLGSFVKNHGLVADFVDAWKRDPATPKILKEELDGLIANEAFKRQ